MRWRYLCEAVSIDSVRGGFQAPKGLCNETEIDDAPGEDSVDAELWELISSLPRARHRKRAQETKQFEQLTSNLRRAGVRSTHQLLFLDAVWGVDSDLLAVHNFLTGISIGFTNT